MTTTRTYTGDVVFTVHPNSGIMGRGFSCSECGAQYNYFFNYCPDCGHPHTRMGGGLHYPIGLPIPECERLMVSALYILENGSQYDVFRTGGKQIGFFDDCGFIAYNSRKRPILKADELNELASIMKKVEWEKNITKKSSKK